MYISQWSRVTESLALADWYQLRHFLAPRGTTSIGCDTALLKLAITPLYDLSKTVFKWKVMCCQKSTSCHSDSSFPVLRQQGRKKLVLVLSEILECSKDARS